MVDEKKVVAGVGCVAIGVDAVATADWAVAIGNGAQAHGKDSTAIGHGVVVHGDGECQVEVEDWHEFFQELRASLTGV